jgi:hypothetical protein
MKRRYYKKRHRKNVEQEVLRSLKKYVKKSTYRKFVAACKDKTKTENSICIPFWVKRREDDNKKFIRLTAKLSRMLYGGTGNDTQTIISVMDLAFQKKDYRMLGLLAELIDPEEEDAEAARLLCRLYSQRLMEDRRC